jgi:Yip1-like protein
MKPELSYDSANSDGPAQLNFLSRVTGVWFSPGETFTEISQAKGAFGTILAPMLALIIIGSIFGVVGIRRIGLDNMMREVEKQTQRMVDRGFIPQERAEMAIEQQRQRMSLTSLSIQNGATYGLIYIVFALIIAGVFKLASVIMGWQNRFKYLFSVTLYTSLSVGIVFYLIGFALLFLKNPEEIQLPTLVGSNLAVVLNAVMGEGALTGFLKGLAMAVDVFAIWKIILLSIGFAAVSGKLKASTAGIALGVLYALISLAFAPLAGMFS